MMSASELRRPPRFPEDWAEAEVEEQPVDPVQRRVRQAMSVSEGRGQYVEAEGHLLELGERQAAESEEQDRVAHEVEADFVSG